MNKQNLKTYFSPCPNDTFIFGPLVHGQIDSPFDFTVHLEDIEKLNQIALDDTPDLIKVSAALYPQLKDKYTLLDAGAAMGKGVGPLLVTTEGCEEFKSVALPGEHTTAHFLFDFLYPDFNGKKVEMVFSDIQDAVLSGKVDAGVLIHEGRFTYHEKNLKLIDDLGEMWATQTDKPLPLGLIMVSKSMSEEDIEHLTKAIQESIEYSWTVYPELDSFVTINAQELSEETMRQHIELYVNEYTMNLGDEGRAALYYLEKQEKK